MTSNAGYLYNGRKKGHVVFLISAQKLNTSYSFWFLLAIFYRQVVFKLA